MQRLFPKAMEPPPKKGLKKLQLPDEKGRVELFNLIGA
jgi:hypothetical protein